MFKILSWSDKTELLVNIVHMLFSLLPTFLFLCRVYRYLMINDEILFCCQSMEIWQLVIGIQMPPFVNPSTFIIDGLILKVTEFFPPQKISGCFHFARNSRNQIVFFEKRNIYICMYVYIYSILECFIVYQVQKMYLLWIHSFIFHTDSLIKEVL